MSRATGRALRVLVAFVALLVLLGVGIAAVGPLRWRAIVLLEEATGHLKDVEWSDLRWMLGRNNGVDLQLLSSTSNPYLAIESPRASKEDFNSGKQLFSENCQLCHGDEARGGPGGPDLHNHTYRQGRSDWALYLTILRGVSNTAMVGRNMPRDDVWRLVTYLKRATVDAANESPTARPALIEPLTAVDLKNAPARPTEWLTYSGSYSGQRHSALQQINRNNVEQLRVEWMRQFSTTVERVETTPIVRGSTMFVTEPPNRVEALDASTGRVLWVYSRNLPAHLQLCCGQVNRGVALLGNRLFVGTLDAHLIALNADTGKVLWDVEVADSSKSYSITAAPLVADDMVLTGVGGGEYGIQGFLDAYDAASGQRRWRFKTIPDPGQPGSETWEGNSLKVGGAATWLTGAFDPELRLVYWGVGNPSMNFNGAVRPGDNLYSNSVIAVNVDTGKLQWHFQFTPHDSHDWDSVQIPVLVDTVVDGMPRKLLAWANRNGFYYLLDRATGKFLLGTPFVRQNWADGLDANGRPHVRPESAPSLQGSLVYPNLLGATNWSSPSYDSELSLFFVPAVDRGSIFYLWPDRPPEETGARLGGYDARVPGEDLTVAVKALELKTGRVRWEYSRRYSNPERKAMSEMGGLLSTAGELVFGGDADKFFALDSKTGAELWRFDAGGYIAAAPVSYEQGGRQYVAIAAGRSILAFALPPSASHNGPPPKGR